MERALLTLIKREEVQAISAQRQATRDAQQARERINIQRLIETSLKRIADKTALRPSEIRTLQQAVEDSKKLNRLDEAQAIQNRIDKHESQFAARRRMIRPELTTLHSILENLGFEITIRPKKGSKRAD